MIYLRFKAIHSNDNITMSLFSIFFILGTMAW